jgi:hypothetical protein
MRFSKYSKYVLLVKLGQHFTQRRSGVLALRADGLGCKAVSTRHGKHMDRISRLCLAETAAIE